MIFKEIAFIIIILLQNIKFFYSYLLQGISFRRKWKEERKLLSTQVTSILSSSKHHLSVLQHHSPRLSRQR